MVTNYKDYYDERLQAGLRYQDFIMMKLHSEGIVLQNIQSQEFQLKRENLLGCEIKLDEKFRTTGNLYIEVAEKSHPSKQSYFPSGIYRDDNNWLYGIGDYDGFYIFSKKTLQRAYKSGHYREVTTPTSRGFLFPVCKAESGADRKFNWQQVSA